LERLSQIEEAVSKLKLPASFADQFFTLRSYMNMVRERIMRSAN
jgi:hypothetical protein